jgi:16S rRNA (uracil1498-N3)-methyltransferase
VARLVPVITQRTVAKPEGSERLAAIAREAAEQCERLTVPPVEAPAPLDAWLAARDPRVPALAAITQEKAAVPIAEALSGQPAPTLLIGPEGGWSPAERERLRTAPGVRPVSLGPLVLRAETAALVALAAWRITAAADRGRR